MNVRAVALTVGCSVVLTACGTAPQAATPGDRPARVYDGSTKTLVIATRTSPINSVMGGESNPGVENLNRFFNAGLTILDGQNRPMPYLAAAVPEMHSDSWRIFPDGRMETTYPLKRGLVWHDGAPFSAEDYVFRWKVDLNPEIGSPGAIPQRLMEEVVAVDANTLLIRWKQPFPQAGDLRHYPLPRHILEPHLANLVVEAWENMPFRNQDFVGTGPYRVTKWDTGVMLEGEAFEHYVFGKPKIGKLRLVSIPDPNTLVANMLAGAVHMVQGVTIRSAQGRTLESEWAKRGGGGKVIYTPVQTRFLFFQMRPDYAPAQILDLRVRQAILHTMDRDGLAEALLGPQGRGTHVFSVPTSPDYGRIDAAVPKYPLDIRRAQSLMETAGYVKGAGGAYGKSGEPPLIPVQWRATQGNDSDIEIGILADGARRAGIAAQEFILPRGAGSEFNNTFPGIHDWSTTGYPDARYENFGRADRAPGPENRWSGNNKGGWLDPDYVRIAEALAVTLEPEGLTRYRAAAEKYLSETAAVAPLYYNLDVIAHLDSLRGVVVTPYSMLGHNIEDWGLD